jgi:hypothetical protein
VNHDHLADRLRPEHLPDGRSVVDYYEAADAVQTSARISYHAALVRRQVRPPEWAAETVAHSLLASTSYQFGEDGELHIHYKRALFLLLSAYESGYSHAATRAARGVGQAAIRQPEAAG